MASKPAERVKAPCGMRLGVCDSIADRRARIVAMGGGTHTPAEVAEALRISAHVVTRDASDLRRMGHRIVWAARRSAPTSAASKPPVECPGCGGPMDATRAHGGLCRQCANVEAQRRAAAERASPWPKGRAQPGADPIDIRQPHIAAALARLPADASDEVRMLAAMIVAGVTVGISAEPKQGKAK